MENTTEITKIDNIKNLWQQLGNSGEKTEFILLLASETGKSPNTIRQHWLSNAGFWSIPEDEQDRVIELLQKTIAIQNTSK